jgi:hypothetical protein
MIDHQREITQTVRGINKLNDLGLGVGVVAGL